MVQEQLYNITTEWQLYFYLLRCAIRGEQGNLQQMEKYCMVEKERLVEIAVKANQGMLMMPYILEFDNHVHHSNNKSQIPVSAIINEYKKYEWIRNIIKKGKEENVQFVFFKGCVLADLYPNYIQRTSCDTDIFVKREQKDAAVGILKKLEYQWVIEKSNSEVQVFVQKNSKHVVELHTCLWEDYTGKRLELLDSLNLTDEKSLLNVKVCGMQVTTLGYEEHLIFQMFHIIKHFSLQGIGIKYLTDIALYVNRYGKNIDYTSLWKKFEILGYAKFCYEFFVLCVDLLGMNPDILKGHEIVVHEEIVLLLHDLLEGGVVYGKKNAKWQILGMMTPYFVGEKTTSHKRFKRKLEVVFPRTKDLPVEYQYAQKCPLLLPVAWIHKMINYLVKYYKNRQSWYNVNEKLDVAERRIALLDCLDLITEEIER